MTDVIEVDERVAEAPQPAVTLADLMLPLFEGLSAAQARIVVALVEREVGQRYRQWAEQLFLENHQRQLLLACAEREDKNAEVLEASVPDSLAIVKQLGQTLPCLSDLLDTALAGQSTAQQFTALSEAEMMGSYTYQSFADEELDPKLKQRLLQCVQLELDNAQALASLAQLDAG